MPRMKKPVREMTTDQIANIVFPKPVKKELQRLAIEPKKKEPKKG